jgi:hypothetical protein
VSPPMGLCVGKWLRFARHPSHARFLVLPALDPLSSPTTTLLFFLGCRVLCTKVLDTGHWMDPHQLSIRTHPPQIHTLESKPCTCLFPLSRPILSLPPLPFTSLYLFPSSPPLPLLRSSSFSLPTTPPPSIHPLPIQRLRVRRRRRILEYRRIFPFPHRPAYLRI